VRGIAPTGKSTDTLRNLGIGAETLQRFLKHQGDQPTQARLYILDEASLVTYSKRCEINCRCSSSHTEFSEEKTHIRAKAFVVAIGWGWMGGLGWRLGAAAGGEQWPDNFLSQQQQSR
jgi:hypothetical protein